ncbi:hypothetical protein [Alienimonas sp. DA493]|uniref:hypothetical protein n=1 Tax=Alienimonas sp. DA493 TaxID=3373605 RepID=UPI00375433B8
MATDSSSPLRRLQAQREEAAARLQQQVEHLELLEEVLTAQGVDFVLEAVEEFKRNAAAAGNDDSGLTDAAKVERFLSQQSGPVATAVIAEGTGLTASAVRTVLYGPKSEMFEFHPHPDHSTRRRWTLRTTSDTDDRQPDDGDTESGKQVEPEEADDQDLPGVREAILQWLDENPAGAPASDIIDNLLGKFKTRSEDPENVMRKTLHTLYRKGLVHTEKRRGRRWYMPAEVTWGQADDEREAEM